MNNNEHCACANPTEKTRLQEIVGGEHDVARVQRVVKRIGCNIAALDRQQIIRQPVFWHANLVEDSHALEQEHTTNHQRVHARGLGESEHIKIPIHHTLEQRCYLSVGEGQTPDVENVKPVEMESEIGCTRCAPRSKNTKQHAHLAVTERSSEGGLGSSYPGFCDGPMHPRWGLRRVVHLGRTPRWARAPVEAWHGWRGFALRDDDSTGNRQHELKEKKA
jgi:hypothetical protein